MTNLIKRILGNNSKDETSAESESTSVDRNRRYRGKIFRIHTAGYGFISSKEIPFERIFFHWSALSPGTLNFKNLEEGMQVEFSAREVPEKGMRAIKIVVVNEFDNEDR